jgi:glycosyltransferase involved in cell wall biosynthesis
LSNISNILLESGLWELIFKPVLSEGLIKWVENFKPEVIYCQGYDLTFSWLPLMLSRKFNLPICFQTTDDWPDYLYKTSIVSFLIRPIVHKAVKELIVSSSCRLAFSDSMVVEYAKRYGFPFEKIMLGDNIHRFRQSITRHVVKKEKFSVIYSGKLEVGRWKSLVELCKAAEFLRSEGLDIVVTAFASSIPPEAINRLKNIQNLQILPPPDHEVLPSYLKGADVLFLPESFDPKLAQGFRHSISTKAVLYMMSERPILVYASPLNGVTKYAKCEGWAYVVDQPQNGLLIDALRLLLTNQDFKEKMVRKALKVALKNHDEERIRVRFLLLIRSIV